MKNLIIVIQLCLVGNILYAQNSQHQYEQIGFDFFIKNVIVKEFNYVKFFVYNGMIDTKSNGYSDCMYIKENDIGVFDKTKEIDFTNNNGVKIVERISFFKRMFTSGFRIKNIHVFKSYITKNEVMTCIAVYDDSQYTYFNFKIDPLTNQVVKYCKTVLIE